MFNPEQKRQNIQKLTDAMVSIEGENMRGVTWVKISEELRRQSDLFTDLIELRPLIARGLP